MSQDARYPRVNFRLGPLAPHLAARGAEAAQVAKRDLARYYALLDRELATVSLTEPEALLLCDALNGVLVEPHTLPLLWATVDDAIRLDGLDRKWGVDGAQLVARLRALSAGQAAAVVDAVEQVWAAVAAGAADIAAETRRVGLSRLSAR